MSDILLNKMLPNSLNKSNILRKINEVLQPYLNENWDELIARLFLYNKIDLLDEEFLNHLAYQFHVDFWDKDLSIDKKRKLIKNSIKYHKHKGTPYAVEEMLSDIFDDTWIKEWFEYGGKPYYFKIFTKDKIKNLKTYEDLIRALNTVKNTRSWLESIVLVREHILQISETAYLRNLRKTTFYPYSEALRKFELEEYQATYLRNVKKTKFDIYKGIKNQFKIEYSSSVAMRSRKFKIYGFDIDELKAVYDFKGSTWWDIKDMDFRHAQFFDWEYLGGQYEKNG